jgi:hypothetical protein
MLHALSILSSSSLWMFLHSPATCPRSRDSSVGIATGYGVNYRGVAVLSPGRVKNFLSSKSSRPALWSTHPPIQWVSGLFPGIERPGRQADHSPPTSAEVKKMRAYTSTPPYTGTSLPFTCPYVPSLLQFWKIFWRGNLICNQTTYRQTDTLCCHASLFCYLSISS